MTDVQKKKLKKGLEIAANALVWLFVAFSILVTLLVFTAQANKDGVPQLFGKSLITIETQSMEPTIPQGSMFLINKFATFNPDTNETEGDVTVYDLLPGDVITYKAPIDINGDGNIGDINTHRILTIDTVARTIQTVGDNNKTPSGEPDPDKYTVSFADVIGYVREADVADATIGGLGAVIGFLRSSLGFFLCIVLPLILFFLYELYHFITLVVAERTKKKLAAAPVSAETEEEIKRKAIEEYLAQQAAQQAAAQAQNAENNGQTPDDNTPAQG